MADDLFPSASKEELVQRREERYKDCQHEEIRVVNVRTGQRTVQCRLCRREREEKRMRMDALTWPPPPNEPGLENLETEYTYDSTESTGPR